MGLADSEVQLNFDFFSDDDGRNGINDGFRGVGINNITLKGIHLCRRCFIPISRTGVDAEDSSTDLIAEHDFNSGVYMVEVETIFDNTTAGTNWYVCRRVGNSKQHQACYF